MHQPIRDNLEEHLKASGRTIPQEFHEHLAACKECAGELRQHEAQARMLRSLQAEREMEPRPGFYARVMERIEQQRPQSIWSILLEPRFGRRIAVASAVMAVLLGTYLVTTEPSAPDLASSQQDTVLTVVPADSPLTVEGNTLRLQRQRDAVLVNLASYHE